ncbi:MAG: PD-(D/E)XK nuclease family protein [Clostridia bacterium]|nr:PD-(D/E)XK nuclease family protein [Clostridia bacterium]
MKELVDSDFKVYENGNFRKVKYSDFAILTRSNSSALNYYNALKCKDIPSSLVCEGEVLFEYEIAQVISLLKVLDNPYDNVAMITILYSEMFEFSPEELLELKNTIRSSNWIDILKSKNVPEKLKEKADYFNRTIEELKDYSLKHSIEDLIKKIYEVTNLEKYITGLAEMKSKSESMRVLLEYTRKYEKYGTRNLYDYISDISKLIDAGKDIEKKEEVETGNTVNVVTMHKSKGLEYSVVFLPSLNKSIKGRPGMTSTQVDKDLGYMSKFIDAEEFLKENNFYYAVMNLKRDMDSIAEEIRIFYVALTRAKEKLYLVGKTKDEKYNPVNDISDGKLKYSYIASCQTYYDFVKPALALPNSHDYIEKTLMNDYDVVIDNEKVTKSKVLDYIVDVDKELNKEEFKYEFESSKNLNKKVSVSEVKRRHMIEDLDDDLSEEDILNTKIELSSEEVVKKIKRKDINTLAPNEKGTLMHKLVKILDGENLDAEFDKLISEGIFTENELSQINKDNIYRYFESDVFNDIKNSNFVKRELPFMMKKKACEVFKDETSEDEVIIQGIIDCVYEKDGKLVVLDYKTDRVHGYDSKENRIEEIKRMYKIQLDIYEEAIRNIYNKEIDKKILYLFDSGDVVEV